MANLDPIENSDLFVAASNGITGYVTGEDFKKIFTPQIINLGQLGGAINPSLNSPFAASVSAVYFGAVMTYSDSSAFTYEWTIPAFLELLTPSTSSTIKTKPKRAGAGIVRCTVIPAPGYTGYPIPLTLTLEVACSG